AADGRRMSRRTYGRLAIAAEIAVPIAILVAWQLWTAHAHSPKFPRLSTILVDFRKQWLFAEFGTHVVPSLERIGLGFAIGVLVGVLLGLPLGLSPLLRKIAMPHIEYWRAMPPPALLPISVVLLRAIVLIGLLGYFLNVLFLLVERRVLAWHRGWRASSPQ